MSLQTLLSAFAGCRVFIACKIVPRENGKTDKIPVNPHTGANIDAQDSANWLTLDEVEHWRTHSLGAYHVGIVISESLGLFCIDLDAAYQNGQWSQFAVDMCARFPGAYVEVSSSGTGLHIFGRHANVPPHKTRSAVTPGLEIYTRARFILLTGTSGTGDINTDHTVALQTAIAQYLPGLPNERATEWTTEPYRGWRGGGTDEQILNSMLNSRTARSVFGGGITFEQLFNADQDALAKHFPGKDGKAWDMSGADQALANHLMYGTGYNCERALTIMKLSPMRREKWEREDYLERTVLRALDGKPEEVEVPPAVVYDAPTSSNAQSVTDTPPQAAGVPPPSPPSEPVRYAAGEYMSVDKQETLFKNCVYIKDIHQILREDGIIEDRARFDVSFGGHEFQMQADGAKPTGSAWEAFTQSRVRYFPKVHGLYFDPLQPAHTKIVRDELEYMNSWNPITIKRTPGDVSKFLNHLAKCIPDLRDRGIFTAFMAFVIKHPGVKARWCPLLQGVEGNGKTFFSEVLEACIGQRYTHWPKADNLNNHFNAAFYGKLLICVEDVKISDGKEPLWEALKPMITGTRLEVTPKGVDSVTREICFNFILNSNHKDAVRKTRNDRRIAAFFCAQQHESDLARCGMTEKYFIDLYEWAKNGGFEAIGHYLHNYDIPDEYNPAKGCIRAPITTSTEAAIHAGRGAIEQEVIESIEQGRVGFRGGWVSSTAFDHLLVELGKSRALPRNKRHEILDTLGYSTHPSLPDGRVERVLPDQSRPKLYVLKDCDALLALGPDQAVQAYLEAQAVK